MPHSVRFLIAMALAVFLPAVGDGAGTPGSEASPDLPGTPEAGGAEAGAAVPAPIPLPKRINRLVQVDRDPQRAVTLGLAHLVPDSSDAELRQALGLAYVARDQVCVAFPPSAEGFQHAVEFRACDLSILPPATRDTVMALFRSQAVLAPDDVKSNLLIAGHEARFGKPALLRRELEGLARWRDPRAKKAIQSHLIEELGKIKRPPAAGVIADYLLGTKRLPPRNRRHERRLVSGHHLDNLDCMGMQVLITALVRAGNFEGAGAAMRRVSAGDSCFKELLPTMTMALSLGGRYRELWELTKSISIELDTIGYYRYSMTAVLTAAHFDTGMARKRLAHERVNEEAYPEEARSVMSAIDSLLASPDAPAGRWADLADRSLLLSDWLRDIRYLAHSLALKRDPGLERSNQAHADYLIKRDMQLLAAGRFADLAGGRTPGLDRRWDPRRPRFLRQAAECAFAAEEDATCLALLDLIPEQTAEDELMRGVVLLRSGDGEGAAEAFARGKKLTRSTLLGEALQRLAEVAAEVAS